MNTSDRIKFFARDILLLVGIPSVEIFILRAAFRAQLGPGNVSLGSEAVDLVVPGVLGTCLFIWLLTENQSFQYALRVPNLILNLVFLCLLLSLLSINHSSIGKIGYVSYAFMLCTLSFSILFSCWSVYIPFQPFSSLMRNSPQLFLAFLFCLWLLTGYVHLVYYLWQPIVAITGPAVCFILSGIGMGVKCTIGKHFGINHPQFSALISEPCSGMEGIFFFLFTFSILLMFEKGTPRPFRMLKYYLLGVLMMFLLNIFRISLFFAAATLAVKYWGRALAHKYFIGAFHNHVGWILYFIGIGLFMNFYSKRISRGTVPGEVTP